MAKTKKLEPKIGLEYIEVAANATGYGVEEFAEQLKDSLTFFKLVVVEDPRYEGSNMVGILICNRKPTKAELKEIKEEWS